MKAYCIAVLAFCTMALAISAICLSDAVISMVSPETGLSGYSYSQYISFNVYKKKAMKAACSQYYEAPAATPKYSAEEWDAKWKSYRDRVLKEEKHDGLSSLVSSLISIFLFAGLLIGHLFLFKKYNKQ